MDIPSQREPQEDFLRLLRLLQRVHTYSPTVKSDYAREYAVEVAAAASMGHVTVLVVPGGSLYGRRWKLTMLGAAYLEHWSGQISEDEQAAYLEHETEDAAEEA